MTEDISRPNSLFGSLKQLFRRKSGETVRETIEDLIEESNGDENFSEHEQLLLSNILDLKDTKCGHAMVPRADIIAFHKDGTVGELAELMLSKGHSRIPVYGDSLDDILGVIHVIDLLKPLAEGKPDTKVIDYALDGLDVKDRSKVLLIGDNLATDIKGANLSGLSAALVTKAVHVNFLGEGYIPDVAKTRELATNFDAYPDFIISNLRW